MVAGLALVGLFTAYGGFRHDDVNEYHRYAIRFWTWSPHLHWLPREYPPLAVVPFSLTLLPPLSNYAAVFGAWMGLLFLAGYVAFSRYTSRGRAAAFALYLLVGGAGTLLGRFDLVPALVAVAALHSTLRHRHGLAYVLLGLGTLLKLYPAFLIPLVALHQWRELSGSHLGTGWDRAVSRRVLRTAMPAMAVVILGFGIALVLNAWGTVSPFVYAGQRPLQVESVPASLLWLGSLAGIPAWPIKSFGSSNYVGPLDVLLKPLSFLAMMAGIVFVYWRQALGRLDVGRAAIAVVAVLLVTGKVLSPQYVIWILPLVAAESGLSVGWLAVAVLTTLIYPFQYMRDGLLVPEAPAVYTWQMQLLVAIRNALLLVLTMRAVTAGRAIDIVREPRGLPRDDSRLIADERRA